MLDRLSLVSWFPWSAKAKTWLDQEDPGGNGGRLIKGEALGLGGEVFCQRLATPGLPGLPTYRLDFNPNRIFDATRYSWADLRRVVGLWWDLDALEFPSAFADVRGIEQEAENAGYVNPAEKLRLRVSRYDLNADVNGRADAWLSVVNRPYSQRAALYWERGRLNGFYIGKRPLVRVYQKAPDLVRVEYQDRPRGMRFDQLQGFFSDGFSMTAQTGLSFAEATYPGDGLISRAFDLVRDADGLQNALRLLTSYQRKRVQLQDSGELAAEIDAAYWESFLSTDAINELQQARELAELQADGEAA